MSSDSFEVMKLWVPLERHWSSNKTEDTKPWDIYSSYITPIDNEKTALAWEKASELAKEGWELVSGIPITASFFPSMEEKGRSTYPRDLSLTYTSGYELLFKRRIPKES